MSEYVAFRKADIEALMEEWGDLDADPFWRPIPMVVVEQRRPASLPLTDTEAVVKSNGQAVYRLGGEHDT